MLFQIKTNETNQVTVNSEVSCTSGIFGHSNRLNFFFFFFDVRISQTVLSCFRSSNYYSRSNNRYHDGRPLIGCYCCEVSNSLTVGVALKTH